jgi:hypothetical protein
LKIALSTLALVALVGLPLAASAQPRPFDPPPREMMPRPEGHMPGSLMPGAPGAQMPGADPFHLLMNSSEVHADLGLTRQQLVALERAARNFHTRLEELSRPRPGQPPDQAQAGLQRHLMEARGMIARELKPEQLARLQQIMLQLEGPCLAAVDRNLQGELELTPEQERALNQACQARAHRMREAFRPPQNPAEFCAALAANRVRIEQIRADADQQVMSLLTPKQTAVFARMTGKKLSLEPPKPPECG